MILENVDFDEIRDVYGVFPLKKDFLEAGNQALEKLGLKAVVEENVIRIPYLSRPFYSEEDLDYLRDVGCEEDIVEDVSKWLLKAEALIWMGENPDDGIVEVGIEAYVFGTEEDDDICLEDQFGSEDEEAARKAIERFLDTAMDTGE